MRRAGQRRQSESALLLRQRNAEGLNACEQSRLYQIEMALLTLANEENQMKRRPIFALAVLTFLLGTPAMSTAQVKTIQMKIAGYLCGY